MVLLMLAGLSIRDLILLLLSESAGVCIGNLRKSPLLGQTSISPASIYNSMITFMIITDPAL